MVLPALVVLALVAVVAIAARGSTPRGGGETRPPSDSLLDAIFSVGLVAVVLGGVIAVYGLTQRKAIASELASGRYPRTSIVAYLTFFGLFTVVSYWRLRDWDPRQLGGEDRGLAFPVETPQPTGAETDAPAGYEPDVSWLPIAVVIGLVLAAVVAYVVAERRARGDRRSGDVLAEQLAVVLDETLDDLRAETDPRRAIIAAYARLERVLAANGVARRTAETADEYLPRVLLDLELDSGAVQRLTTLFTRAKFSQHDVNKAMKEEAIDALERVRDELRLVGREPVLTPAKAPAAGARA